MNEVQIEQHLSLDRLAHRCREQFGAAPDGRVVLIVDGGGGMRARCESDDPDASGPFRYELETLRATAIRHFRGAQQCNITVLSEDGIVKACHNDRRVAIPPISERSGEPPG